MNTSNGQTAAARAARIDSPRGAPPSWTDENAFDCTPLPRQSGRSVNTPPSVPETAQKIDDWISQRVKQARLERGFSQEALAQKLGISLQQIHKYEAGRNRISATRLAAIADVLGKPLDAFFEGLEEGESADAAPVGASGESGPLERGRECLELVRNFEQINNPEQRRALLAFLHTLKVQDSD